MGPAAGVHSAGDKPERYMFLCGRFSARLWVVDFHLRGMLVGVYSVEVCRRSETKSEINFNNAPAASIISANSASDPIGVSGAVLLSSSWVLPRINAFTARPADAER